MQERQKWAPLALRLVFGSAFLYHGLPKLFSLDAHNQLVGMLQGIGIPVAGLTAWIVGLVEVLGGVSLLLGAYTTLFASLLIVEMFVAMLTVHLPLGFNFINITGMTPEGPVFGMPGYEVNLLYIAGLLTLLVGGPGRLAIDRYREARATHPAGVRRVADRPERERVGVGADSEPGSAES
jgi:putative oxidoreductase